MGRLIDADKFEAFVIRTNGDEEFVNGVQYVLEKIEEYKNNSEDHYDFWNEHIKYVYEESLILASKYNADKEIVELGALLHDIALMTKTGTNKILHILFRLMN